MKKISFVFLITLTVLYTTIISAQQNLQVTTPEKKNKAFFAIDVSGAFNLPILDLRGSDDIKGFWNFQDYGVKAGFGTSLNFKFSVLTLKMSQLRTYLTLGYSHYSNDDNRAFVITRYNWWNTKTVVPPGWPYIGAPNRGYYVPADTLGQSYIRLNMPYIAVGAEFAVYTDRANKSAFNFGLDYNMTIIAGRIYNTIAFNEEFNTLRPAIRFGIGTNIYYTYKFDDIFGFHVGTRFTLPNLFGKSAEMSDEEGYIFINDRNNPVLNPSLTSSRTMGSLNFFGGISLHFGKR